MQYLLDSYYCFLSISFRCVGSTHDAFEYAVSSIAAYLTSRFSVQFWICGDDAYVYKENRIAPILPSKVNGVQYSITF